MMLLRYLMLGLWCAGLLVACEPGNNLKSFSGRELRAVLLPPSGSGERVVFKAELLPKAPEAGCLQLRPGVEATLNGTPLTVTPGLALAADGPCSDPEQFPTFIGPLESQRFFEEPMNGVLEIRDGDERIVAEYRNFFAPHTFAQPTPPPSAKPGAELFLPWDPPTDDLSIMKEVVIGEPGVRVPVRPAEGGLHVTLPADLPTGPTRVSARASNIPAERCEGVALCTAVSLLIVPRVVQITVQP
jgi:hypothetical protein